LANAVVTAGEAVDAATLGAFVESPSGAAGIAVVGISSSFSQSILP
jgi:hypothetical protein